MKYHLALCSDTHGRAPPLFVETHVDALLHAGDVYHGPKIYKSPKRLHALREWIKWIGIPVFAVRGNHDFLDPAAFFSYLGDLTGHVKRVTPTLLVAGLGLAFPTYHDFPTNDNLLDASARILIEARKLHAPADRLILLSHYSVPARSNLNSPHVYTAIGTLLAELADTVALRPLAIVEGHIHEGLNATDFHDLPSEPIPVYRPGPTGAVLEIDDVSWQLKYHPY